MPVTLTGAPTGASVYLAVVERGLVVAVKAGELKGKTLHHDAAVRCSATDSEIVGGKITLTASLPTDLKVANAMAIVMVQEAKTLKGLGASGKDQPAKAP